MQAEFFEQFKETTDKELAAILHECERYALADHRYDFETLCEEVRTAPAGAFANFFGNIPESNDDSGVDGDFFASLEASAHSAALPKLKQVALDHFQRELSYV